MAKKTTKRGTTQKETTEVNLSEEMREIVGKNKEITGKEAIAEIEKKYPGYKANKGSAGVAFSMARSFHGISKPRGQKKVARRQKPSARTKSISGSGDVATVLDAIKAAKRLIDLAGGVDQAKLILKHVADESE